MRCKKHPSDLSSSVGVCASCLRERLFTLIAAQAQVQQHAQLAQAQLRATVEDRRKPDAQPPPLVFPRSVSPYVSRRKSDDTASHHHHQGNNINHLDHRFYSTPQVGPTHGAGYPAPFVWKKKRFSLFSSLFRSRSEKISSDARPSSRDSSETSSSSPSWFSSILTGRRQNQLRLYSLDDSTSSVQRHGRTLDRGMSPARAVDYDDDCDGSPSGSTHSSESSPQRWRRTPVVGPPSTGRKGRHGHGRNVAGLAFCLSPLVRASPNRHWKRNGGGFPPELAYSGEVRVSAKPHLSTAASFCANRSRKLADFGRVNNNR